MKKIKDRLKKATEEQRPMWGYERGGELKEQLDSIATMVCESQDFIITNIEFRNEPIVEWSERMPLPVSQKMTITVEVIKNGIGR